MLDQPSILFHGSAGDAIEEVRHASLPQDERQRGGIRGRQQGQGLLSFEPAQKRSGAGDLAGVDHGFGGRHGVFVEPVT